MMMVNGSSLKAIIHEELGDGIMSAIDCKLDISRKDGPNGSRVVLTIDGKFLPYYQGKLEKI